MSSSISDRSLVERGLPIEELFELEWPQEMRRTLELADISFSIAAVGDLMLGGSALPVIHREGIHYPFVKTRSLLKSS